MELRFLKKKSMKSKIVNTVYSLSLMLFIIAFDFQHNPPGGWYQQFMPDLGNLSIRDITFVDSLTGYAVAGTGNPGDTNRILKTINSGDNWSIIHSVYRDLSRIKFLDVNTGYVCGGLNYASSYLAKTTDGGLSWQPVIQAGFAVRFSDMAVLNQDTIWLVDAISINSGIYRTTNGGSSWQVQFGGTPGGNKPDKIYMYDGKFGFAGRSTANFLWRTTDSGLNWDLLKGESGFRDMYFADSLIGWKTRPIKKTNDGGMTWINQVLPSGGNISQFSNMYYLNNVNKDTIHGTGGALNVGFNDYRAIIYTTYDGGNLWKYQIPDTSFRIQSLGFINFIDTKFGWAQFIRGNIHTKTGGDTVLLKLEQNNTVIPSNYFLHQNYPNPFNPVTRIRFDIPEAEDVILIVYDILGKQVDVLLNERLTTGSYEYTYNAVGLSSGVYFYSLITGKAVLTKKMLLTK